MAIVAPGRWQLAAFLVVLALALAVAAAVKRRPMDFSALAPLALMRDRQDRPLWAIRVAVRAHLIAVDALGAPPPPSGHAYQLWLAGTKAVRSLGLLPIAGRRVIPESPTSIARLEAGGGELIVTLEPAHGSATGQPSGRVLFRQPLTAALPSRSGCAMVACMSRTHQIMACGSRACISRTLQEAGTIAGGWR